MKVLLLDIDYTLFCELKPRPHLKGFLERVSQQYNLYFYTAASRERITEVCRILYHQLGLNDELVQHLNRYSLSRESCPMIDYKTENGSHIDVKCLHKAAEKLGVSFDDVTLLDDNPTYDNPDKEKRIQAPAFYGQANDDYLLNLLL